MILTPLIERAIKRASVLHRNQVRRDEFSVPYVTHLFSVGALLSEYASSEEVIVAGLLHDTLEDTSYTEKEIEREFGKNVKNIVLSVTEATTAEKKHTMFSWKERKLRYLDKLQVASAEALMVSAADKIHNLQTLVDDYSRKGESVWKDFHASREEQLWFFGEVLGILEDRLDSPIVSKLRRVYDEAVQVCNPKKK